MGLNCVLAVLRGEGAIPVVREERMLMVMRGEIETEYAFVRSRSSWQVKGLDCLIRSVVSETDRKQMLRATGRGAEREYGR